MKHLRPYVGARVLLQLEGDTTIDGLLETVDRPGVTLVSAAVLSADGSHRPIDGRVVVEAGRIMWTQVP